MRIATYNVNGISARLPVLLRWLAESRPDVACLQELKAPQERFPALALCEAGYRAVWHGQKGWNGVAIPVRGEGPVEAAGGPAAASVAVTFWQASSARGSDRRWNPPPPGSW